MVIESSHAQNIFLGLKLEHQQTFFATLEASLSKRAFFESRVLSKRLFAKTKGFATAFLIYLIMKEQAKEESYVEYKEILESAVGNLQF